MTAPTIAHARKMQLEASAEIEATGWDERGAVLGLADYFAEEFLLEEGAMTYISFCSGIEAATVGWHPLGWKPLAFCEIDKAASKVLAHYYPSVPNLGDFTAVDWSKWSADICVGGTPCQAFSVAGLRKSLADDRGNLSLEFIRAVNIIRPRFVVWENVPGVLSTSDNAFGCFLAGLVGCPEPIVFEQGFPNAGVVDGPDRRAAWRILDAQYFGLAQRRKRVFVVASSGDGPHPAEILFEWESLRRDYPPSREAGEGITGTIAALAGGGGGLGTDFDCDGGLISATLRKCADSFGGQHVTSALIAFPLQLTNQGSGGNLPFGGANDPVFCFTREGTQGVAHSLRAGGEGGTGRGTPIVAMCFKENMSMPSVGENISPTLQAENYNAVAFEPRFARNGRGAPDTIASPLKAESGRTGKGDGATCVQSGMVVRRLTPVECERLMGFPDNYTLVNSMADGNRYRCLGNSMAVPCMSWIGRRIQELTHGQKTID